MQVDEHRAVERHRRITLEPGGDGDEMIALDPGDRVTLRTLGVGDRATVLCGQCVEDFLGHREVLWLTQSYSSETAAVLICSRLRRSWLWPRPAEIRSCKRISASSTCSGRGGQPGMYTSTGMT